MDVALHTGAGGEDDYTHDRLSLLKVVGSEFGPLIYKLPEDAGFHALAEQCKTVWDALEKNPQLPHMLVRHSGICSLVPWHTVIIILSSDAKLENTC